MKKAEIMKEEEEEEPLSPMARVFQSPEIDLCVIIDIGFKTKINTDVVFHALKHNVYKHPRFSSKLSENGEKWIDTEVNVEDHVIIPTIDPEEICEGEGQSFVDDYMSRLTMIPLDRSRPLWDIHILNIKTSDAEAVVVLRFNHALADGMSFFSLVIACTHKTSNPDMLSTATPSVKRRSTVSYSPKNTGWFLRARFTIGSIVRLIWNTVVDMFLLFATLLFLKDTETPLKGGSNVRTNPKRFYHKNISLNDIKLIKNAMDMTINDVLLGITTAALSRYLNRQYDVYKDNEEKRALMTSYPNNLPDGIRFRAGCTANLRSDIGFKPLEEMMAKDSKCRWGNYFSFIILPLSIGLETDPLVYLKKSKAMMARKKHSYHAALMYFVIKIFLKVLGPKATSSLLNKYVMNITTCVSNVMGPMEEISFHGHPIAYISPTSYGHSQAFLIHYTSYAEKITITIAVDPTVIPDPHKIFDDMEESLKTMKGALSKRGLL